MVAVQRNWDPCSGVAWAQALGLVHVPMFAAAPPKDPKWTKGKHAVLLDGERGSLTFTVIDDAMLAQDTTPLSWAWSSHVGHAVIAVETPGPLYIRRWDAPSLSQPVRIPQTQEEAGDVFAAIERDSPAQKADVVQFVLRTFRQIRSLHSCTESVWAVRLLNSMLLATELARSGKDQRKKVSGTATLGELVACLPEADRTLAEVNDIPAAIKSEDIRLLIADLVGYVHYQGLQLYPSLLLRHASSRLYQEAHLQIERSPQLVFADMASDNEPQGKLPKDVRFTPANLARTLVQQAIRALGPIPRNVSVLDPACGSGVFLQEFLKEMSLGGIPGTANIVGYDVSPVSVCMARFCLNAAARDLGRKHGRPNIDIQQRDSLQNRGWANADIVLMNPPFIPWTGLPPASQSLVSETLGEMSAGRPDIAMAFVWNAIMSLKPGGVLACVLPAALLSSTSGKAWRERIQGEGEIVVLGRFEGYRYFSTSLVETSFLVFRRKGKGHAGDTPARQAVEVLVAREGCEDASLRALRLSEADPRRNTDGVQVFSVKPSVLSIDSWRPQRKDAYEHLDWLRSQHRAVRDLFEIRQGIRIGEKSTFLLSVADYQQLPETERSYFRPAVGPNTLKDGRLLKKEFIFFPYDESGLQIRTEHDLQRLLPEYHKKWLQPKEHLLRNRPRIRNWWELSEHRAWQNSRARHIVSTYFGKRGSFAYNSTGDFVVVNGYAWIWKGDVRQYDQGLLPWAYVALLNSEPFERVLSWTSVQLQGGQFRLERKYLAPVPMPDLGDEARYSPEAVQELAELGKAIGKGLLSHISSTVDRLAGSLFGLTGQPPQ